MKMQKIKREFTLMEEIVNAVTHGIGFGMSIAALVVLLVFGSKNGTAIHIVSFSIYGATMIILYLASTLYHSFPKGKTKNILEIIDHCAIYLLIAGTYTPFTLLVLKGKIGWIIFFIIWVIAVAGVVFKAVFIKKFKILSTLFYIFMGWMIVSAIKPLIANLQSGGFWLLVLGGVLYTVGTIFYTWEKVKFNHAIWHLFVFGGSMAHFFSVFLYLVP